MSISIQSIAKATVITQKLFILFSVDIENIVLGDHCHRAGRKVCLEKMSTENESCGPKHRIIDTGKTCMENEVVDREKDCREKTSAKKAKTYVKL